MSKWVRLCSATEAPTEGKLAQAEANGIAICLATVGGKLQAIDNVCPHRQAPLAEGWIEEGKVICPWHSWVFDPGTGQAKYPEGEKVAVFNVKVDGEHILVHLED